MTAEASAVIIGAASTLIGALVAGFVAIRNELRAVHKVVNQHATDERAYRQVLIKALHDAGIEVPVDVATVKAET